MNWLALSAVLLAAPVGAQNSQFFHEQRNGNRDNYVGVIGGSFLTGSSNVFVSHVGYYLTNAAGLHRSHQVGVFAANGGTLLGSALVPSGAGPLVTNGYAWAALNPPLLLANNTLHVLATEVFTNDGDVWPDRTTYTNWNPYFVGANTWGGSGTNNYQCYYSPSGAAWPTFPVTYFGPGTMYGAMNLALLPVGAPVVLTPTTNVSTPAGAAVTLAPYANGQYPLTYQWYQAPATLLAGQTNAALTFANPQLTNAGAYYLAVSNALGGVLSSPITLTVGVTNLTYIRVDPTTVVVTNFLGWGTSLAWWANLVGGYSNRDDYATLAFTRLKLNIVRYNIGCTENPNIPNTIQLRARIPGFEPTNGVWNWNADANQRWMLRQAVALGANRVEASSYSPPWWMTVSGSVTGSTNGTGSNLQTNYENAFAIYLALVVSNLTVNDGIRFDLVTPMNEASSSWWKLGGSQPGCALGAAQQSRLILDLSSNLSALNLPAGIDASEDYDPSITLSSLGGYSAAGLNAVSVLSTHSYNPGGLTAMRNQAAAWQKPVWTAEYGDGDATGLTLARRIRDDVAVMGAQAWVYWQVCDYAGWGCISNNLDGSGDMTYSLAEKFYVLGQFSQFISPGSQILNVSDTNSLAAYYAASNSLVIVTVNDSTNPYTAGFDLGGFSVLPAQAACYRTSAGENQRPFFLTLTNATLVSLIPAQSVTTFVLNDWSLGPTITSVQTNSVILAGRTLTITNTATDPDLPAQSLSWSLPLAPAGALINPSSGVFTWRPAMAQSPSTNRVVVAVTENVAPAITVTQTQFVTVTQPAKPAMSFPSLAAGNFAVVISGDSGPDYVLQATTNLDGAAGWAPVATNASGSPPFQFVVAATTNAPQKFYRVLLQP